LAVFVLSLIERFCLAGLRSSRPFCSWINHCEPSGRDAGQGGAERPAFKKNGRVRRDARRRRREPDGVRDQRAAGLFDREGRPWQPCWIADPLVVLPGELHAELDTVGLRQLVSLLEGSGRLSSSRQEAECGLSATHKSPRFSRSCRTSPLRSFTTARRPERTCAKSTSRRSVTVLFGPVWRAGLFRT